LDLGVITWKILRRLGASRRDVRLLAPLWSISAATVVASAAAYAVRLSLGDASKLAVLAACGAAFAAVHLITAFVAGAVTSDEKQQLRDAAARFQRFGDFVRGLTAAGARQGLR